MEAAKPYTNLCLPGISLVTPYVPMSVAHLRTPAAIRAPQGFGLVGLGSFAFHATLLFQAQLADELPMVYVGSMSLWLLFDDEPGFSLRSLRTRSLIAALIAFDVLFTWS
jgi:hypothetical protein